MFYLSMKILMMLMVVVSVAFVTLLERKILSFVQNRLGPTKVSLYGILQPISDAVKLLTKEKMGLILTNILIFNLSSILSLMMMLMFWVLVSEKKQEGVVSSLDLLIFIFLSSLMAYVVIFSGWASNSKYSMLGAYRGVAQIISYEVGMIFLILSLILLNESLNFFSMVSFQDKGLMKIWGMVILFIMWLVIFLAESNRTPFDFAEGESELVSGFNVEYGGVLFAILFLSEYGSIMFLSWMSSMFFFGKNNFFIMMIILMVVLGIRGVYVRFRYDLLMMLAWKVILSFVIFFMWLQLMILIL